MEEIIECTIYMNLLKRSHKFILYTHLQITIEHVPKVQAFSAQ